jgi:hypothetical protein
MSRLQVGLALALTFASSYASAQSQAEIANKENEEGKELMFSGKYAEASAKFQDAVARVPEAKYFFNLCTSRYQEGKFGEALTACNAVSKNGADDKLKGKTDKLVEKIKDEAKAQGIALQPEGGGAAPGDTPPPGGGDPNMNNPPPPPGGGPPPPPGGVAVTPAAQGTYAVGRPPDQSLLQAAPPEHHYTWTLGVDLYGGGGRIGQPDWYGSAASGVRIKADYLLNPAKKIGAEAYLQITHFGQGNMQSAVVDTLDVFDIGLAGYKHLCPRGVQRLCLTPLAGAHLAMMGPGSQQSDPTMTATDYAALGLRLQVSADIALGRHYEHVLSAMVGVNAYSAVFASPSPDSCPNGFATCSAADVGLDKGGAFAYVGFGYTYRFDTPFGQAPFVTLE